MTTVTSSDGLRWEVTPGDHDGLGPSHEDEITPIVLRLIPPRGVFLDVGAHVGHYAIRAAALGARVIAIEPNPSTAARLRQNARLNRVTIIVAEVAAWDGAAPLRLERVHAQYERDGSGRVVPDPHGTVGGVRLDDALSQYPLRPDCLDVVKIDTEGAELRVLDGMAGLLARHRPVIFAEDHAYLGCYPRDALELALARLDYDPEPVGFEGALWWLARPRRSRAGTQ